MGVRPCLHRRCVTRRLPSRVLTDQRKESAVTFLEAAVAYYAKLGIRIERVMTDNGSCYRSKSCFEPRLQTPWPSSQIIHQIHTLQRPTAKPSASSKPRFRDGHMRKHIKTQGRANRRAAKLASPLQLAPPAW